MPAGADDLTAELGRVSFGDGVPDVLEFALGEFLDFGDGFGVVVVECLGGAQRLYEVEVAWRTCCDYVVAGSGGRFG